MTSQVAVYNMNGIAIASDTVVTSSSNVGSKTTSNAEKIYEVGDGHKVLVMHYGGTMLNDVNHQFHFSEWALTLSQPLKTLTDYMEAYIHWTSFGKKFHSHESEAREMLGVIDEHFEYLKKRITQEFEKLNLPDDISDDDRTAAILSLNSQVILEGLEYLESLPMLEGFTEASVSEAVSVSEIDLQKYIEESFSDYYLNPEIVNLLKSSAITALARHQDMAWDSYLAFVGYGLEDPFPGVAVLTCRGIYAGKLAHVRGERVVIKHGGIPAEISSFAQREAIQAFLSGYNSDIMAGVKWSIEKEINSKFENSSEAAREVREKVAEYISEHSWRTYQQPILRQVAGMNLFGLAELARTLVSIQATFSESQDGPVSVGGLIEVVTIDRVNGVRWKQRLPR